MNLSEFSEKVAKDEGLKVNLPIGQIKEVQRIIFKILKDMSFSDVIDLLKRVKRVK